MLNRRKSVCYDEHGADIFHLFQGILNKQPGFQNLTVGADNFRFVWEIPSQDLQANKNLVSNWSQK